MWLLCMVKRLVSCCFGHSLHESVCVPAVLQLFSCRTLQRAWCHLTVLSVSGFRHWTWCMHVLGMVYWLHRALQTDAWLQHTVRLRHSKGGVLQVTRYSHLASTAGGIALQGSTCMAFPTNTHFKRHLIYHTGVCRDSLGALLDVWHSHFMLHVTFCGLCRTPCRGLWWHAEVASRVVAVVRCGCVRSFCVVGSAVRDII